MSDKAITAYRPSRDTRRNLASGTDGAFCGVSARGFGREATLPGNRGAGGGIGSFRRSEAGDSRDKKWNGSNACLDSLVSAGSVSFHVGGVALRIRRGNLCLYLPRSWVRGAISMGEIQPLPLSDGYARGVVAYEGRLLPALDPAVFVGEGPEPGGRVGVLIGRADRPPFAVLVSGDGGRYVSMPASAGLRSTGGWFLPLRGCGASCWWIEASRLEHELYG